MVTLPVESNDQLFGRHMAVTDVPRVVYWK